jgi:hypothetical protein
MPNNTYQLHSIIQASREDEGVYVCPLVLAPAVYVILVHRQSRAVSAH